MSVKYELGFKIQDGSWKVFDTYKSISDPNLKRFYRAISKQEYNLGVRVMKIKTTIELIDFDGGETDE